MQVHFLWLFLLNAYLCGSLPFGYFFAKKVKGKYFDIRDWGSSNIGFTNVWKVLGLKIGLPVLIADILKGFVPVLLCRLFFGEVWGGIALLLAALGHARSIYFFWKEGVFSGGKAVATLLGGTFALQPVVAIVALVVWGVVLKFSKYMSVASLSGGLIAFVSSLLLRQGLYWNIIFGLVFLAVVFTHMRNIGRLIQGIEPKITENRGAGGLDPKKKIVAFGVHPLSMLDVKQMAPWLIRLLEKKVITERDIRRIIRYLPIIESDQITGIKTKDGCEITVLFLSIPLMPDQIKDPSAYSRILYAMLKAATVQAQRRGATVFTLGALLSTERNGGEELQKWAIDRGLTIKIDNGATYTIAATLAALERETRKPLSECTLATIGASGFIGGTIVRLVARQNKTKVQLAYARDDRKMEGLKNLATLLSSDDLAGLSEADIVILSTSSPDFIITPQNCHVLKENAVVLDVAAPADFDDEVLKLRPDIKLVRCGLISLPGEPEWKIDLHFGSIKKQSREVKLVPACLAQCTILAATGEYKYAATGAIIRQADVDFFTEAAERLGYEIITSEVSESEVFKRVER